MKKSIIQNITQLFLIVFSVVLGLYLSERIEDRKNQKQANNLLAKIKLELNENKKILDSWVPYHREVVKKLDSLYKNKLFVEKFISDYTTIYSAFSRGTIMSESPANDAWDIAKSHPLIVNFEYDELLILSKLYKQQKSAYDLVPKLVEVLLSSDLNARENAKSNLHLVKNMLHDITSRELLLISYYNEAENILNYQNNSE